MKFSKSANVQNVGDYRYCLVDIPTNSESFFYLYFNTPKAVKKFFKLQGKKYLGGYSIWDEEIGGYLEIDEVKELAL